MQLKCGAKAVGAKTVRPKIQSYRDDAGSLRAVMLTRHLDVQRHASAKLKLELARINAERETLPVEDQKKFDLLPMTPELQLRHFTVEYTRRLMHDRHVRDLFSGVHYFTRSLTTVNQAIVAFQKRQTTKESLVASLYEIFPKTAVQKFSPLKWHKQLRKREFAIDLWVRLHAVLHGHSSRPPFFEKEIIAFALRQFQFMHSSTVHYVHSLPVCVSVKSPNPNKAPRSHSAPTRSCLSTSASTSHSLPICAPVTATSISLLSPLPSTPPPSDT